jgi:hypothetical protein
MSNSFPERCKTTVLGAFATLFNKGVYAGGRRLGTELQSAQQTHTSRSRWSTMRFAAALLVALASFVAVPNAALAAEPQHHDQVPGSPCKSFQVGSVPFKMQNSSILLLRSR